MQLLGRFASQMISVFSSWLRRHLTVSRQGPGTPAAGFALETNPPTCLSGGQVPGANGAVAARGDERLGVRGENQLRQPHMTQPHGAEPGHTPPGGKGSPYRSVPGSERASRPDSC